ncbi:DNA mismatch repair protein MutS [Subsaximicrobium wynnwilliamsii]|uniref:DNA mismatch repair protein MutS n=1 Tax=Subsaximicrobium wynnwilliamsii TaxID=291179 RepID=A0A5C6ZI40_9FLAO|nr:DNA mismatch repair protein MutS [Subsaximicrobium wynnwilliamsii]TXD82889.1 DNA mismatch repair protein MutS [Subsaximicrobium wynnwilliamsii]TXD88611.1 DNA mismatch repair protein MutS [Subsaximicrobium wynnwilliamsii]TXE02703.1 DNA mismatch repair protein MutS [Subsaximicrobium wynnwilliamsii]
MKIYRDNIKLNAAKLVRLSKLLNRYSWLRLFFFIISTAILISLFIFNLITAIFIAFPILILGFALVIKHHDKIAYLKKQTSFLKTINESEILREECDLEAFDPGDEFINQNHPYSADLDVFGQHSIFQLVNRTTTESGAMLLSEWLSDPAPNHEIYDRQEAIKELSQKLDWRQGFQASGMHFQNKNSDYFKLLAWVEKPATLLKNQHLYIAAAISLPVLLVLVSYFFYTNLNPSNTIIYVALLILVLLTNYMILRKLSPIAENIVETSTENLSTLKSYQTLIHKIESESFKSKKLNKLQSVFTKGNYSAYHEIKKLCSILEFSHQRPIKKIPIGGNYMYPLLNSVLLLDIYLIIGTEQWKSKNKTFLKSWAEVVSGFEVVNSFAGFCYSNPSYTFPELTEKNNYIHFESLGHPLIHSNERVCNDFNSEGAGNIVMITGSNMGGKSTFLRSVGLNLVLALAGAPCCATYAKLTNLNIFTSMRTQDNLMKGISSFYAELNRIEKMLKLIERNDNVYFLLDEMFKGTNSEDRHKGGYSLINQLNKLKTSGIIATHDIDLAKLSGSKNLVTNYSFNSEIKEHSMIFSYELDPGICTDFNASELMKKSGIEILSTISEERR